MRKTPMHVLLTFLAGVITQSGSAMAEVPSPDVLHDLAPTGVVRAAINYGNPVLAQRDPKTGEPRGVSAVLARTLAARLDVPVSFVTFDAAGRVFDALEKGAWDIAFLAVDPKRAEGIEFTAPYVVIEGTYLVARASPLSAIADVDRPGIRVAVGKNSAYDLYLSRSLQQAEIVRAPTSAEAVTLYVEKGLDVAAGVKSPLVAYAAAHPGYRLLPGRFMAIEQAMGVPKGRQAGVRYLQAFVEEMKADGVVAKALAESGQADAVVAPAASAR